MAPRSCRQVELSDLEGHFKVHYDGDYMFDVLSEKTGDNPKSLPKNTASEPLRFKFIPKQGHKELPSWFNGRKVQRIEKWGAPYFAYTTVVDGESWIASTTGAGKKIRWICCRNADDRCVWTRVANSARSLFPRTSPSKGARTINKVKRNNKAAAKKSRKKQ